MDLIEAISLYREKFDEGPGIWGMDEDEAIAAMVEAVETGKPMEGLSDENLPDGALG